MRESLGKCPCGGNLYRKDADWASCDKCMDDGFPLSAYAAGEDETPNEEWRKVGEGFARHLGVWTEGMTPTQCHEACFAKLLSNETQRAYQVLPANPDSKDEVTRSEDANRAKEGHLTLVKRPSGDMVIIVAPARDGECLPPAGVVQFNRRNGASPRTWQALHQLFDAMALDTEYDRRREDQ